MEEGSQMSMNAFVKACEAYEANILMLKEKIGDLERKLAEQDMKIQAPIRNDNAFLLKLAAIRKYENWDNHEWTTKKTLSDRKRIMTLPKVITSDRYDRAYATKEWNEILFINNKLFSYCSDPGEILSNINYANFFDSKIIEILVNCLNKLEFYNGHLKPFGTILLEDVEDAEYDEDDEDWDTVKAQLAVHMDSTNKLYLGLVVCRETSKSRFPSVIVIELDDLSNKEYIEKNFNVENLLE